MKMEIYGFKVDVHRGGEWFIGEIDELHIHNQAKSLRKLESELKDAVDRCSVPARKEQSQGDEVSCT